MRRLTRLDFIERARGVHGDIYDYSKVDYRDIHSNVEIICRKHDSFFQSPSNHLKGHGCSICNKYDARCFGLDEFVKRSRSVHGATYDYQNVCYVNSKTKVGILCKKHGLFYQKPEKHWIGHGCPKCAVNCKMTTLDFIKKAREVHGDLYDYSKVYYVDEHTEVCIIDSDYGEFWQQPNLHLSGRGNPRRRGEKTYLTKLNRGSHSKTTLTVYDALVHKFGSDNVFVEYKSDVYPFYCDFYIKSYDLYIELNLHFTHGYHWFDSSCQADIDLLNVWKEKSANSRYYLSCIYIWTVSDVLKKKTAIDNNLNYVVFWKSDLSDFYDWYDNFDEFGITSLY